MFIRPVDSCNFYRHTYYGTDTIINGKTYQPIKNTIVGTTYGCTYSPYAAPSYYIREDTTTGIVYCISNPTVDTSENILYNYNLSLGDTIHYSNPLAARADSVVLFDSTKINGVYHKVWGIRIVRDYSGTSSTLTFGPEHYTVVEGVGSVLNYWQPFCYLSGGEPDWLQCFYHKGIAVPISSHFIASGNGSVEVFLPSDSILITTGDCRRLTIDDEYSNAQQITIFPNPVTESLNFGSKKNTEKVTIHISDLTGRTVYYQKELNLNGESINTTDWSNGIYLILIKNNTGVLKRDKIVIAN
ncbi:T9SS type A sorting domain-containing protein [Flavipsychrobacter stenotrophus]|nr:T9SS type A sorting domain-containing protein [Flavipsychrobacter stenotrophus]